jgi:hypothetical protein
MLNSPATLLNLRQRADSNGNTRGHHHRGNSACPLARGSASLAERRLAHYFPSWAARRVPLDMCRWACVDGPVSLPRALAVTSRSRQLLTAVFSWSFEELAMVAEQ